MSTAAYSRIIASIFDKHHRPEAVEVPFGREEIVETAVSLGLPRPKNLGDVIYTFRFRRQLPDSIRATAPKDREWIIRQRGDALYAFVLVRPPRLEPRSDLAQIRIPNSTPGLISRYALDDEQALLAIVRYNRLIDIFTGIACYSLQNHLRTKVKELGQVETDEVYVGVDKRGVHYVFPVQAKGGRDKHSIVQIEQDFAMAAAKFPDLVCRPIAVQFLAGRALAILEFVETPSGSKIADEKHYEVVPQEEITAADLQTYLRAGPAR